MHVLYNFLKSIFEISSGYLKESLDEIKKQTLKGYLMWWYTSKK